MHLKTLFLSLFSTILFGIIDGTLFMVSERELQSVFMRIPGFDTNMAELASGGVSTSIAIFITFYTYDIIHRHYHLVDHPLLDSAGVMIGTCIILLVYYLYKRYKTEIGEVIQTIHPIRNNLHATKDQSAIKEQPAIKDHFSLD